MSGDSNSEHNRRRDYDLRDWLRHLETSGRLAVAKEGVDLRYELAGIANRLDGKQATFFPKPNGHAVSVVSGLASNRAWIAEALGLRESELVDAGQDAAANPYASIAHINLPPQNIRLVRHIAPNKNM